MSVDVALVENALRNEVAQVRERHWVIVRDATLTDASGGYLSARHRRSISGWCCPFGAVVINRNLRTTDEVDYQTGAHALGLTDAQADAFVEGFDSVCDQQPSGPNADWFLLGQRLAQEWVDTL